jgi:hypothetical protein
LFVAVLAKFVIAVCQTCTSQDGACRLKAVIVTRQAIKRTPARMERNVNTRSAMTDSRNCRFGCPTTQNL